MKQYLYIFIDFWQRTMKKGSSNGKRPPNSYNSTKKKRKSVSTKPKYGNVYELNHIRAQRNNNKQNTVKKKTANKTNKINKNKTTKYANISKMPKNNAMPKTKRTVYRNTTPPKKVSRVTKKRRKSYAAKRLPILVFLFVVVYFTIQMGTTMMKKANTVTNVETVSYGSIDTPMTLQAIIVRDEYVITSDRAGQPFYQYAEGNYISKSSVVCEVKDITTTENLEQKLSELDKNILESQQNRSDLSLFAEDISRIERNIEETVDTFSMRSMKSDVSYLYTMRSQLENYMTQRNEIWLSENVETLSQLTEEKNIYEQQLSESMSQIIAPESGILAMSYDGLESTLTPDQLESITIGQVAGDGSMTEISKIQSVEQGTPLFRIVKSNQWYLVSNIPNELVSDWEQGDVYTLDLQSEDRILSLQCVVESVQPGETETKIVFSCFSHMNNFIDERIISYSMQSAIIEGIKIPNSAIVEKSLLKIPQDCLTEQNETTGVQLINGTSTKFIAINRVSSDDSYVYVSQIDSDIQMGDTIQKGTDQIYTISEQQAMPGVYVANSSMAKFVPITILDQNQEYAIVKSNSTYGLQAYDTIVSDAKTTTEGQSIY